MGELQVALESQKMKWSRSLNSDKEEAQAVDDAVRQLNAEIESLQTDAGQPLNPAGWRTWWEEFTNATGEQAESPEISSSDAPMALDRALRALESHKRASERRVSSLDELISVASNLADASVRLEAPSGR